MASEGRDFGRIAGAFIAGGVASLDQKPGTASPAQMSVVVPPGVIAGSKMQVSTPSGPMEVVVPANVQPGESFTFDMPAPPTPAAIMPATAHPAAMGFAAAGVANVAAVDPLGIRAKLQNNPNLHDAVPSGKDVQRDFCPSRPKVVEKTADRLVVMEDTSLAWFLDILFPIFLPCILCQPRLRWTFDRKEDTITKEYGWCSWTAADTSWTLYQGASVEKRVSNFRRKKDITGRDYDLSYIVKLEGAGVAPILMTSEACGAPKEYNECCIFCHPSDETRLLCEVVNDFMRANAA